MTAPFAPGHGAGRRGDGDVLVLWAERTAHRGGRVAGRGCLRFALYGRRSTEDRQDPVTSRVGVGRDRDRGVRARLLRQPVRLDGSPCSSTTAFSCGCRRSAGAWTGTPRITSRPCSRSACRRNGDHPERMPEKSRLWGFNVSGAGKHGDSARCSLFVPPPGLRTAGAASAGHPPALRAIAATALADGPGGARQLGCALADPGYLP